MRVRGVSDQECNRVRVRVRDPCRCGDGADGECDPELYESNGGGGRGPSQGGLLFCTKSVASHSQPPTTTGVHDDDDDNNNTHRHHANRTWTRGLQRQRSTMVDLS